MRRAARLALVALLVTTAACASDGRDASPAGSAPGPTLPTVVRNADGIGASIQQWREDEVKGVVQVKIWNGSSGDLRVDELALSWTGFEAPTTGAPAYVIGRRDRIDLPLPVVPARCQAPPQLTDAPPAAVAEVTVTGAIGDEPGTFTIPVTDIEGVLERIYRSDCRKQTVLWNAGIAFADTWTREDRDGRVVLAGEIVIDRRSGVGPIVIDDLRGSVLLTLTPAVTPAGDDAPIEVMAADVDQIRIPIELANARCDPHALGESKKPYVFQIKVVLPAGDAVDITLEPTPTQQAVVYQVIRDGCGV